MQVPCTSPKTVGFTADGKITFSKKNFNKELAPVQIPCRQCLECRLSYAREWAIRCVHEAQVHEQNSFITLTYADDKLKSEKLIESDFDEFIKKLRHHPYTDADGIYRSRHQTPKIGPPYKPKFGVFGVGEYGEKTKRPHWHAIIFGWSPTDAVPKYTTEAGHQVAASKTLNTCWGHGIAEVGTVTIDSAGYCARYSAKKLVHGFDGEHEYEPIPKKSLKPAIGKRWLEKYCNDVFNYGKLIHDFKDVGTIPRYYESWFKKNHPEKWLRYIEKIKLEKNSLAAARAKTEEEHWWSVYNNRPLTAKTPLTRNQVRQLIKQKEFDELQAYLKF